MLRSVLITALMYRLSSLGYEGGIEILLSHAIFALVARTSRAYIWVGKGTQRLLGTRCPSHSDFVAHWVRSVAVALGVSGYLFTRWSYLINLTLIGNAVYVSMDIPDIFLAVRTWFTTY